MVRGVGGRGRGRRKRREREEREEGEGKEVKGIIYLLNIVLPVCF